MLDAITAYAKQIVHKSVEVKVGEVVMISLLGLPGMDLVRALHKEIAAAGADSIIQVWDTRCFGEWIAEATEKSMKIMAHSQVELIRQVNTYIAVNAQENSVELGDIPKEKMFAFFKSQQDVFAVRETKKQLTCLVPTPSMAQANQMSTSAFEKYFYDAVTYDFNLQMNGMRALKKRMEETKMVHIIAPGTNLKVELNNVPCIICDGKVNLPDGEVFTGPKRDGVNGYITFNTVSTYRGGRFEHVKLTFENGKIVATECANPMLEQILNSHPNCRYLGEFAIGTNPMVTRPMANILFDEKLAGSIHIAMGKCYEFADNGNAAAPIHWDMVLMMTKKMGGGKLYFDDALIMDDGVFVPEDLTELNADNTSR